MTTETAEALSPLSIRDLLDAGLHFGHQTKRWNPKMKPFIFDKRNGIHIIDLTKSLEQLTKAERFLADTVAAGRQVLFVGTKKQAQNVIKETASRCGQPYVVTRWLGGTLTNSPTIRRRVKYMQQLQQMAKDGSLDKLPKKEVARLRHELEKLEKHLTGIAGMTSMPGALFVVDIQREAIAIAEANRLHIPVVAIVDTNCDPDPIDYPIPGNDDAIRAVKLILDRLAVTLEKALAEYSRIAAEKAQAEAQSPATAGAAPAEEGERKRPARRPRTGGDAPRRKTGRAGETRGRARPSAKDGAPSAGQEKPQQEPETAEEKKE